ncbi:MAG: AIPR family protein [Candidatus Pacebacteria bacterium]|nr:AIPR family protein [Candidatus Paceibacterota bacterium]
MRSDQISNQDYNLVKSGVKKITNDIGSIYGFSEDSISFQFLVLSSLFKRQEDEIIEDVTDTIFLQKINNIDAGPDRGIDSLIIDYENNIVHFFNFKYTDIELERVKGKNFPSSEINNILAFIRDLYEKNKEAFLGNSANDRLEDKVKEIWKKQDSGTIFSFKIHFVANLFQGLTEPEEGRLISNLQNYKDVSFDYILVSDISDILINRSVKVSGKFKALNKNFFDKVEGGNRALILEVPALDLLRITTNNLDLRNKIDFSDDEILRSDIEENIFDDNVRLYLKQRTNINKNIKKTALDEKERLNFFFYNNGITITCDKIDYQGERSPTIILENFQIVNGGQSVHALRSAFEETQDGFEDITILCKIYETNDASFKSRIAEYTNSQNPVKDRDIRSIDLVQIKLEEDFKNLGYFYERKRGQYENEDRERKIDSEKLGQALLSFSLEMPAEAKNKKSIIFGDEYEIIFNDNLIAQDALVIFDLYKAIEKKKLENKSAKPYLVHASYYVMFFIKKLSGEQRVDLINFYDDALEKIEYIIEKEKSRLGDSDYLDAVLFKSNRPKDYLTELSL